MEKNRKELKTLSILVLALVAIDVILNIITACVNGIPKVQEVPAGMTRELADAIAMVTFILAFVVFIPQIYVGIKGIKIANGAESGKAHMIWAIILAIFACISVITAISSISKGVNANSIMNIISPAVDLFIFVCYFIYARKIANNQ